MRLHHLSATAFGPFAGTVEVDFDRLSQAGIFLLSGPTGAGKTSVLDAVCFAIFGRVPGDRHVANHLRSDHAEPGARPEVVLELTVSGRRLKVTRSPAWQRPRKRGKGLTPERASGTLLEYRGHQWVPLATRLDEIGKFMTELLGMSPDQFMQVVLLPQGGFQTFLRASSEERRKVLERLFRTERFRRVEDWLAEHRRTTRQDSAELGQEVSRTVSRLFEAAGEETPESWHLQDLAEPATQGSLWACCQELAAAGRAKAADLAQRTESARRLCDDAETAATVASRVAHARERGLRAQARLDELESTAADAHALSTRLDRARRAQPIQPLLSLRDRAALKVDRAAATRDMHLDRVRQLLELSEEASGDGVSQAVWENTTQLDPYGSTPEAGDVVPATDQLHTAATLAEQGREVAKRYLETERRRDELLSRQRSLQEQVLDQERDLESLRLATADAPRLRAEAQSALAEATAAAGSLETSQSELVETQRRLSNARQLVQVRKELGEARTAEVDARRAVQDARDEQQQAREERIAGMAAELASGLVVGGSCPVCGSCEHPRPAHGTTEVADRERVAQDAYDDAQHRLGLVAELVRSLQVRASAYAEVCGLPAEVHTVDDAEDEARLADLAVQAAKCRVTVDAARLAHDRLPGLQAELDKQAHDTESAESRTRTLREGLVATRAQLSEVARAVDELSTALRGLLPDLSSSAADLLAQREDEVDSLQAAINAWEKYATAAGDLAQAESDLSKACQTAGFADPSAAASAILSPQEIQVIEAEVRSRAETRATATATLAEPDVSAAMQQEHPDVVAAETAAALARDQRDRLVAEQHYADWAAERVNDLLASLSTALLQWEPLREQAAVANDLASLVAGTSPNNRMRMQLSAYVLSARLRQVVDAANARLSTMGDSRYRLEQSDDLEAGQRRGGLGLWVLDGYTGKNRDPATLSGGETFMVSLALALGLADVVSHEASGPEIDTLFVDEGFGSLDAESLDEVLDALDSLRDHNRVVGLVSHVAEMRERIPTQLVVEKSTTGSRLHLPAGID